jgi:exonuclease III
VTIGELRWLVKKFRPAVLFFSETKMWDKKAQGFMWSLGYTGSFAVSCEGRSGGLALFSKLPYLVSIQGFNAHCIDMTVNQEDSTPWHATFVYGEPKRKLRHMFWDLLRRLRRSDDDAWICCGDFNEVLFYDEHYGSCDRSEAQMELFQNCLQDCNLVDMGFSGPKFTWLQEA